MRRRTAFVGLAVVAALAGGGAAAYTAVADDKSPNTQKAVAPPATSPVVKGDISDTTAVDGTVGYAAEHKLNAGATGTFTWVAAGGSTVSRNERLYDVNGRSVWLMYGDVPMYRPLKDGDKGTDVKQLEQNLKALGYSGFTVDDKFTAGTAEAVKRWQKSHKLEKTGTVGPEDVAFEPGPVRIKTQESKTGDQATPGKPVFTVTSADRVVTVKLKSEQQRLAQPGTKVTVDLPGGGSATGTVQSLGSTAVPDDQKPGNDAKIEAVVVFDGKAPELPDQSPVPVKLTGQTRKGVLSVPVQALMALPQGGFGVQVVENGVVRDVPVETGLFGRGRVEVTGPGLREGLQVGVPKP